MPLQADTEGFEPPVPLGTLVFKTSALNHSAMCPKYRHAEEDPHMTSYPPMGLEPTTHNLRGCCSTDRAKGGRRGYDRIRTYGTSRFTRFPSVRHRPLGHVSKMRPDHPMSIFFSKSSAKNNRVSSGGGGTRTHSAETSDLQSDAPLQLRRATITEATPRCDALTSLELGSNQPATPYESGPGALPDFQR